MTLVSLTDWCHLLAIDPKTLRRWLSLSRIAAQPHPLDARLKCVTPEQVQQVAAAHRRTLADQAGLHFQPAASALTPTSVMSAPVLSSAMPDGSAPITDLTPQLVGLQAHVATLEQQLTLRLLQLQKAQAWRTSHAWTFEDKSQESSQDKGVGSHPDARSIH